MRCVRLDSLRAQSCTRQRPSLVSNHWLRLWLRSSFHSNESRSSENGNLRLLNKSLYDTSLKCYRLGWYARRDKRPSDRIDKGDDDENNLSNNNTMKDFLIQQGIGFERFVYAHKYGYHYPSSTSIVNANVNANANANVNANANANVNNQSRRESDGDFTFSAPHHSQHPSNLAIVHERLPIEAAKTTRILMAPENKNNRIADDSAIDTILQPTFLRGNRVARADVAVRIRTNASAAAAAASAEEEESWEILEVKSSTEKSFRRKVPDLAYTVWVARSAGYTVSRASLIVVDPTYVRKHNNKDTTDAALLEGNNDASRDENKNENNLLYKTIDCTELVESYILDHKMDEKATTIDKITGLGSGCGDGATDSAPPPVKYKLACGKCELLGVECGPPSNSDTNKANIGNTNRQDGSLVLPLKHGIWELPRLSQKQFPDVLQRGLPTLELQDLDLAPDDSLLSILTKNQIKFFHAVATDAVVVERNRLEKCLWDIADRSDPFTMYLDFEAVSVLNPPYPGMVPYETMITQYSLHKRKQHLDEEELDGGCFELLTHSEYLSDPQRDCRKELLEHLLDDLGYGSKSDSSDSSSSGPILVYSSYEKTQLTKLAALFPEHSKAVAHVIEHRLVDLEKIIKECVSHPGFCGRSSIKVTLPALVPGFERAYQNLLTNKNPDGTTGESSSVSGIAEGGAASAAFAELISGVRSEASEVERTRTALLEYCKLDTLALVEIHKALWKLVDDDVEDDQPPSAAQDSIMPSKDWKQQRPKTTTTKCFRTTNQKNTICS